MCIINGLFCILKKAPDYFWINVLRAQRVLNHHKEHGEKIQEWCSGASFKDTISFDFFFFLEYPVKMLFFYVVTVLLWSIHSWNCLSFKMLLHDGQCYLSSVSFRIGALTVYQHFSWFSLMWSVTICMFFPPPRPSLLLSEGCKLGVEA